MITLVLEGAGLAKESMISPQSQIPFGDLTTLGTVRYGDTLLKVVLIGPRSPDPTKAQFFVVELRWAADSDVQKDPLGFLQFSYLPHRFAKRRHVVIHMMGRGYLDLKPNGHSFFLNPMFRGKKLGGLLFAITVAFSNSVLHAQSIGVAEIEVVKVWRHFGLKKKRRNAEAWEHARLVQSLTQTLNTIQAPPAAWYRHEYFPTLHGSVPELFKMHLHRLFDRFVTIKAPWLLNIVENQSPIPPTLGGRLLLKLLKMAA